MHEHWLNLRVRRLAVLLFAGLMLSPAALAQGDGPATDEELDPNPEPDEPRGHVDIPEIGMAPGGSPDSDDPRDAPFFAWDVFGDDSSSTGSGFTTTNSRLPGGLGDFVLPSDPGDLITDHDPITAEDILSAPVWESVVDPAETIPTSIGEFAPEVSGSGQPITGDVVPTPGSGVLLVGGLALLGGRRRRIS